MAVPSPLGLRCIPTPLLRRAPSVPTLEARRTHCIRAVMLPTSLRTFLLLMSARQDRLRKMLDTTWVRAQGGQDGPRPPALSPACGGATETEGDAHHTHRRGDSVGRGLGRWDTRQGSPHAPPAPSRYLVKILAVRSQLGHDGLHAATPGTQCGLWGATGNSCHGRWGRSHEGHTPTFRLSP